MAEIGTCFFGERPEFASTDASFRKAEPNEMLPVFVRKSFRTDVGGFSFAMWGLLLQSCAVEGLVLERHLLVFGLRKQPEGIKGQVRPYKKSVLICILVRLGEVFQ